jgi:hypothetical protein
MTLLKTFVNPSFLLSDEMNHRFLFYLLESFNNWISYQSSGNIHLIYAILHNHDKFYEIKKLNFDQAFHEWGRIKAIKEEKILEDMRRLSIVEDSTPDSPKAQGKKPIKSHDKIKPKFYEFQDYNSVYDEITEMMKLQDNVSNSNKVRNVISMYYKLQRGFDHIKNSGINYDGVLRLRPDTFLNGNIELFQPNDKILYTSTEPRWCLNGNGVNDQLGFGNMEVMDYYTNVYGDLVNIWTENIHLSSAPEVLLKIYLDKFGVDVKDIITKDKWNGVQIQRIMRENKIID